MQSQGRSSSSMMWILGLGGLGLVLVCCCAGAGGFFYFNKQKEDRAAVMIEEREAEARRMEEEERRAAEGLGPQLAPDPLAAGGNAVMITMTVTSSTGLTAIPTGTTCSFPITHRDDAGGLNCQAHVNCNGVALYGDSDTNGFFPCPSFSTSPPAVSGADAQTTANDQDPSFTIDSSSGTVSISDDTAGHNGAFALSGTISVH